MVASMAEMRGIYSAEMWVVSMVCKKVICLVDQTVELRVELMVVLLVHMKVAYLVET